MAIKEIKRVWSPSQLAYVKEFLLHREDELKDVPRCSVGSKATVSETDNEYVKTVDGWKLLCDCDEDGGTGAGGGSDGALVVTFVFNEETGEISADKDFETVKAKVMAGEQVILNYFIEYDDGIKEHFFRSLDSKIVDDDTLCFIGCGYVHISEKNGEQYPNFNIGTILWTSDGKFKEFTGNTYITDLSVINPKSFFLSSSTQGSEKRFRIAVDDSGTLTATEV